MDGEKEGVPQQADSEKAGMSNLYKLARMEPDMVLGLLRELSEILVEKGLLDEEDARRVLKGGIEKWKNQN